MILRRPGRPSTITRRESLPSNHDSLAHPVPLLEDVRDDGIIHSPTNTSASRIPWTRLWHRAIRMRSYSECRSDRNRLVARGVLFAGTTISILIAVLQLRAFVVEYQGPLDHVASIFLEPYYGTSCPVFSIDDAEMANGDESSINYNSTELPSWECDGVHRNIGGMRGRISDEKSLSVPFPRIFMIGARDEDGGDTFRSWERLLHRATANNISRDGDDGTSRRLPRFERINTLEISNRYALSGGAPHGKFATIILNDHHPNSTSIAMAKQSSTNAPQEGYGGRKYLCRKIKWEHRLFAVYQSVFADLLSTYPYDSGFVIVEDDAVLKDPHSFKQEVCDAHANGMDFYSLYRSPLQRSGRRGHASSCIYVHGTVAFYIRRLIMERIVNERRRAYFCRFPVDMYISRLGPWFSTRREIVGHSDGGRVGSAS